MGGRLRLLAAALGGALLIVLMAWLFLTRGPLAPLEVTTVTVARGELAPRVFGIGTVEARRSYLIGPTLPSRVTKVLADHGDRVEAGQLLAELDPVDLDDRMAAAASAQQRAASAVDVAAAQTREAESRRALAQASAERYRELLQKGFVSREAADAKEQEAAATGAARDAAEAAWAAARRDRARLAADQAAVGKQRSQYRLLAPVAGLITARDAEPGSTVVAGQAVLRLVDPASLWVKARIDQGRAGALAVGQPVEIVLRSRPRSPLPGKVARIETVSDAVTEERLVQVAFDAPPPGLAIGELAEVTVALPAVADALWLPTAAVKWQGRDAAVWRLEGGRPALTPVRIGVQTLDGRSQIVEGLPEGDPVVLYSPRELAAGERVRVVEKLAWSGA